MELADFKNMKDTLYSAVIADILDEMGYRNQAMSHTLHPLQDHDVVVGRAFTVLAADVYDIPERPYYMEFKAVDSLQEGDVLVVSTNGSTCSGFWGELLTTAALRHGAVGAVIDGMSRDTKAIRKMDFPLFIRGTSPLDSKGRTDVIAYQCTIACGGITVRPGDIVFGDFDGIVVIPSAIADEVVSRAMEKVRAENVVRDELRAGVSAEEVWNKYHIL